MFKNIEVEFLASRIKLDGKRMPDLFYKVNDNSKYLKGNTFNTYKLMEDAIRNSFSDFDDLECNAITTLKFTSRFRFSLLDISFKAATYTSIRIEFLDNSSLTLMGENRDYLNYDYSFAALKEKYANKEVRSIVCEGSYGSEEFMSITIE